MPLVQLHLLALRVFRPPTSPRYLALATIARIACGLLLLLHAPTTPPRAYGRTYVFERSAMREIRVYMRVSVSRRSEPPQRTPSVREALRASCTNVMCIRRNVLARVRYL